MAVRYTLLRHLGRLRRALVHRLDPEPMRHLCRPILGHHEAAGVRRQAHSPSHADVRGTGVVGRRLHLTAAPAHPRQRARVGDGCALLRGLPKLRLPDLRHLLRLLPAAHHHALRLLPDLPGGTANRPG